jgi:hypothetical protein
MTPEEYAARLWDWTPLNGCFPRGIRLTDVDGGVEIGGEFLEIEGKPFGAELPTGQAYYFFRKVARGIRVILIEGDPPSTIRRVSVLHNRRKSQWPGSGWSYRRYNGDYKLLARMMKLWAALAGGNRRR